MSKDIIHRSVDFWNIAQTFIYHYLSEIRNISSNTVSSYRDGINSYIDYLETEGCIRRKDVCFNDFSKTALVDYLDWMLNVRSLSPKTCNLRVTSVRSFLKYAAGEHKELTALYVSVCDVEAVKTQVKPLEFFEKPQMRAVLSAPDLRSRTGRRNRTMLILLYDTAARVSELLELSVGSLHLSSDVPYVTLHGKGDKYRNVPLMSKTVGHLKKYLDEFHSERLGDAPLFYAVTHGNLHRLSPDTLGKLIKNCASLATKAGVDMPASCHCHMVRKTRAMDLYQSGVPLPHIQQMLGHEDISTTSGFYAFATLATLAKSMEKVDEASMNMVKEWKNPKTTAKLYSL
jgi:site-specific recombinase XerD